ncbi:SUKH-3 domain-containing protein [Hazenella coriacea]|uniref:SUKH-3 immunity protein of toxin-antitoxin system n=1 Tax=Hazenella coriacea TaxID=1179467 RepID=A0A4R3L6K2_9BACL|nr:SUKH-3 domain-containing protein [Hazenella coriacea]TCS95511.1 SUKH-3 immunity protein of toxin-antitoxin system [Hazenella coriacea]
MNQLSSETYKILTESGWHPQRKADIKSTVQFLESKGYQLFPSVIATLSEFGGIRCSFTRSNGDQDSFHLIPEKALGDYYEKEDFTEIEMRVNESLIPIGEARHEHMVMFMSESGKVYGETDYCLVKFGNDIHQALDTLCLALPGEEIE